MRDEGVAQVEDRLLTEAEAADGGDLATGGVGGDDGAEVVGHQHPEQRGEVHRGEGADEHRQHDQGVGQQSGGPGVQGGDDGFRSWLTDRGNDYMNEGRYSGEDDIWEFTDIHTMDGERQPGRQWYTTMLPGGKKPATTPGDKWATSQRLSAGRLKAAFEAFGYSLDSDTDEMLGEQVVLQLTIETINKGERASQRTNRVAGLHPLPEGFDPNDFDGDGDSDRDRKSTRLNSSHEVPSRMPSSA